MNHNIMIFKKNLIYGLILAYIYCELLLPDKEGYGTKFTTNRYLIIPLIVYKGMLIIKINKNKAVHIHHWVFFLLLIIILFLIKSKISDTIDLSIYLGYSIGMIIQGLLYKDRFDFFCKNPYM